MWRFLLSAALLCVTSATTSSQDDISLLCHSNKQGARQFTILTGERCIIRIVFSAKYGGLPSKGVLCAQGLICWSVMLEFGIDGGFALFREQCGLGANKIMAIVGKNRGFDLGRSTAFVGKSKRCA